MILMFILLLPAPRRRRRRRRRHCHHHRHRRHHHHTTDHCMFHLHIVCLLQKSAAGIWNGAAAVSHVGIFWGFQPSSRDVALCRGLMPPGQQLMISGYVWYLVNVYAGVNIICRCMFLSSVARRHAKPLRPLVYRFPVIPRFPLGSH